MKKLKYFCDKCNKEINNEFKSHIAGKEERLIINLELIRVSKNNKKRTVYKCTNLQVQNYKNAKKVLNVIVETML